MATGERGYQDAKTMCTSLAEELGISAELVLPSSTGVIGHPLPIEKIVSGIKGIKSELVPYDEKSVAEAIMTTDMWPKYKTVALDGVLLSGVAKGAGMIEPNMATMLSYIVTDAEIPHEVLMGMLKKSVGKSFNMITIDSDMSTSDTVALLANGRAGKVNYNKFQNELDALCIYLAKEIVRNGEGATKLIEVEITGARNYDQAYIVAKAIANSPLVKTAVHGNDANWGRIAAAAGKCGQGVNPAVTTICIGPHTLYSKGEPLGFDETVLKEFFERNKEILLKVDLGLGSETVKVWTCDLSEGYIKENASYRS